jgi:hypothetical protein
MGRLHIVATLDDAAADALAYLEIPPGLLRPAAPAAGSGAGK